MGVWARIVWSSDLKQTSEHVLGWLTLGRLCKSSCWFGPGFSSKWRSHPPCLKLAERFNLPEAWNLPIIASTVSFKQALFVVELKPNCGDKALRKQLYRI